MDAKAKKKVLAQASKLAEKKREEEEQDAKSAKKYKKRWELIKLAMGRSLVDNPNLAK